MIRGHVKPYTIPCLRTGHTRWAATVTLDNDIILWHDYGFESPGEAGDQAAIKVAAFTAMQVAGEPLEPFEPDDMDCD